MQVKHIRHLLEDSMPLIAANVEALEHPKGKLLQLGKSFINMRKIIRENFNCCKCHVTAPKGKFALVLNGRLFVLKTNN